VDETAALGGVPGARRNRRGFSAEKKSLLLRQAKSSTRKGAAFLFLIKG
jgi:hypothetical protein